MTADKQLFYQDANQSNAFIVEKVDYTILYFTIKVSVIKFIN